MVAWKSDVTQKKTAGPFSGQLRKVLLELANCREILRNSWWLLARQVNKG